jgi:ubiquitin carboxyl-terminal hydrolase 48
MPSQDVSAASSAATETKSKSKLGQKKGRGRKSSKGSATDLSSEENDALSKANPQDSRDVTVQGCLDAYLYPEMLEDDNQFYCTNCAKKCDAVRSVSLSQLPPVLNVLIARYVFDRLTFMKKKLSDRVLLPRTLRIPRRSTDPTKGDDDDDEEDSTEDAIYVLCAIQNHRGASAYGGHYVAEAMDWTTGVWYDYNDEEVTLLPSGPNCSYVPAAFSTTFSPIPPPIAANSCGKIKKTPPLRGSSDAYSLFYVERSFLAKTASKLILRGSVSSLSAMEANTIDKMARQRQERYQEMTE